MTSGTPVDSRRRAQVLERLAEAQGAMDAAQLAAAVGVHITTARFHLERLERAGLVRREVTHEGRRGRPSVGYRTVPVDDPATRYRALVDVLASALSYDADRGRARAERAGTVWADGLPDSPDGSAVDLLVARMADLGFEPEDTGRTIELHACPFRDAARAHPDVVCSVHRGLIGRTVESAGARPGSARLMPFVEPQLCAIALADGA